MTKDKFINVGTIGQVMFKKTLVAASIAAELNNPNSVFYNKEELEKLKKIAAGEED